MEELDETHCRKLPAEVATRTGWSGVVRGAPAEVTGRRIRIPDDLPFTWWG